MNKAIFPQNRPDEKILLVKMGAVGDLIMASSLFEAVRKSFPAAEISHLVSNQIFHTVKENPHVDRFILADTDKIYKGSWFSRIQETLRLLFILRKEKFDRVFILHWAWPFNLLAFLSNIPVRVGFSRKREGLLLTHRVKNRKDRNNREAYLDLIRVLGKTAPYRKSHYYLSKEEVAFLDTFVRENSIGAHEPLIALTPGGGQNIKQSMLTRLWPVERYLELLGTLTQAGPYRIVLIAGPDDGPIVDKILEQYPQCIDTRHLGFGQKASILRRCRLLLGNDSAPIHMSMAMGIPTYSLWGPTNPNRYGDPLPHHVRIVNPIECSPCYADGEYPECGDNRCMQAISVEQVWEALQGTLGRKVPIAASMDFYGSTTELPTEVAFLPKAVGLKTPSNS